jgi:hypothetical protein
MPSPAAPSLSAKLDLLIAATDAQTLEIQAQSALIVTLQDDLSRTANYQRFMIESMFGATPSSLGIWDGTDRYL